MDGVIGYQENLGAVFRTYDLAGNIVSLYEKPLETPLFDPFDIILIVGSFWRAGSQGFATRLGVSGVGASISQSGLLGLRTRFHALTQQQLRFGGKPLQRMKDPDRFVPVHILRLAMLHGKRSPDPMGYAGLYLYTIPMKRIGKSYQREVLVRESDYTVPHFLFKH